MIADESGVPTHHVAATSRIIDGEAVLIHTEHNYVHMLNEVGTRVWELSDGTRTIAQIVEVLLSEYDVEEDEAQRTVRGFVQELRQKDLFV